MKGMTVDLSMLSRPSYRTGSWHVLPSNVEDVLNP